MLIVRLKLIEIGSDGKYPIFTTIENYYEKDPPYQPKIGDRFSITDIGHRGEVTYLKVENISQSFCFDKRQVLSYTTIILEDLHVGSINKKILQGIKERTGFSSVVS